MMQTAMRGSIGERVNSFGRSSWPTFRSHSWRKVPNCWHGPIRGQRLPPLEAISEKLHLTPEIEPSPSVEGAAKSFIIRPIDDQDIESVAQLCGDAFAKFYQDRGLELPFGSLGDVHELPKLITAFKATHPNIDCIVAVVVDGEGNEVEVIGTNAIDLRDAIGGVGVVAVKTTTQARGVGRAMMKAVMDMCKKKEEVESMSLVVDSMNNRGFALYKSVGFDVLEFATWIEGVVSDEEEEKALQRAAASGVSIREMRTDDIEACNSLFQKTFGFSRINGLRDSKANDSDRLAFVATRATVLGEEEIVGYTTSMSVAGHYLAENNEILEAIIAFGSRTLKSRGSQSTVSLNLLSRSSSSVLDWALEAGLRVKRHFIWMCSGKPITLAENVAYCPDLYY